MGSWDDQETIVVTEAIGPGPDANHGLREFEPDQRWQEQQVSDTWSLWSGRIDYLGDWHTHPGRSVKPSRLDHETAITISGSAEARAPRPVLVIIGLDSRGSVELGAYVLSNRRLRRARLGVSDG